MSSWAYLPSMCGFGGPFVVWAKRMMRAQSINRFRDQGAMSPKNTVRGVGMWPYETVAIRTAGSGGFVAPAVAPSVGAIQWPGRCGRWRGSADG